MVTTISVIGPSRHRVQQAAERLRVLRPQWQVLEGAGPDVSPTAVLAAVGPWDGPAREVVSAVCSGQGQAFVLSDATAELPPGAESLSSIEDFPDVLEAQQLDQRRWNADAFRADAERADRVKIALRLSATRAAKAIAAEGIHSPAEWDHGLQEFNALLRRETLAQGVEFPSVEQAPPEYPSVASAITPVDIAIAGAAAGGAVAAGFAVGRAFGAPVVGLVLGLLVATGLGVGRIMMLRRGQAHAAATQRAAAFTQQANTITTAVIARINIPRITTEI